MPPHSDRTVHGQGAILDVVAPKAFFSYSRDDVEFVLRLAADLKAAGANVWLDQQDIGPGQEWDRAIETALDTVPQMIVVLSPSAANSRNVRDEISLAIDRRKDVVPVLYRTCELPLQVRRLQYVDFRARYEDGLSALLQRLRIPPGSSAPAPLQHRKTFPLWTILAAALGILAIAAVYWSLRPKAETRKRQPDRIELAAQQESAVVPAAVPDSPPGVDKPLHTAPLANASAKKSHVPVQPGDAPEASGLRLQLQDLNQAIPLIAAEQPRWNGDPVWCDTVTFDLVVSHNRAGSAPLLVNDMAIRMERVAPQVPQSVDCTIDTLRSKPFGIVKENQFHFDLSRNGLSGRFMKSGRPGDAFPVDPNSLLRVGRDKFAISLEKNENQVSYDVSVRAAAPGLYRLWLTANYDSTGPRTVTSQSFLLAK